MRDYPRLVAERAWRRLAGNKEWITLERFVAKVAAFNDIKTATALVGAAIVGRFFLNAHNLPQILFLPQPTSFSTRSEAWRVSATEYIDTATRFAKIDMLDWYLRSVWVPSALAQQWCRNKGYDIQFTQTLKPISSLITSTELQGKPGPKEYEVWSHIEDRFIFLMNTHGDFSRDRGWYQKTVIDRISEELRKDNKPVPDPTSFKRRLKEWLPRWRAANSDAPSRDTVIRTQYALNSHPKRSGNRVSYRQSQCVPNAEGRNARGDLKCHLIRKLPCHLKL